MSSIETCIETLYTYLTDERKQRFEEVLSKRTKYMTVVLEDIYQSRNSSAVMRSADGFGLQDLHIIENEHKWTGTKSVSKGASSWLTLHKYTGEDSAEKCLSVLKSQGFRVVAASPHEGGHTPETLPIDKPIAIVMGTELTGISDYMTSQVDDFVKIKMYGFSESFNLSVATAIILNGLRNRLESTELDRGLNEDERQRLRLIWAYKSLKDPDAILRHFELKLPFEI